MSHAISLKLPRAMDARDAQHFASKKYEYFRKKNEPCSIKFGYVVLKDKCQNAHIKLIGAQKFTTLSPIDDVDNIRAGIFYDFHVWLETDDFIVDVFPRGIIDELTYPTSLVSFKNIIQKDVNDTVIIHGNKSAFGFCGIEYVECTSDASSRLRSVIENSNRTIFYTDLQRKRHDRWASGTSPFLYFYLSRNQNVLNLYTKCIDGIRILLPAFQPILFFLRKKGG